MKNVSTTVAVLVLGVVAVSCAGRGKNPGESAAPPTTVLVPGTLPESGSTKGSSLSPIPLGTKITTLTHDEVTVYEYTSPVANGRLFENPAEGNVYSAIDVELCAGPAGMIGGGGDKPSLFQLVMPDNAHIAATVGIKQPTLLPVELRAGDCVRGWVTYEQPIGKPTTVVYLGPPYALWAL